MIAQQKQHVIGITCPSGYVSAERVAHAVTVLQSWGYKVVTGKTVGNEHHYFSGTDEERRADLQQMLDDPAIDAIIMGRGGYGMSRIIDLIDFTQFAISPKWICGFSDITVLHNHIHAHYGTPTLHSPMCGHFKPGAELNADLISFKNALQSIPQTYTTAPAPLNRAGTAEGELTGGNLSLLVHTIGTDSAVDTTGKILFIEDLGEHLYHIDRMMLQLKRAGLLKQLAGLLLGGFTDLQDTERPFGQSVEEIILDKVREYYYPVCFNFPAGHQEVNFTLTLGVKHSLSVDAKGGTLVSYV